MADSDITVAGLVAKPGVQQNKLEWTISDPNTLPYLALDAVEVWSATADDRADGTFARVGEGITDFVHGGISEEVTRYYWIRPRNMSGFYGDWYPASPTAGISGKSLGQAGMVFGLSNAKVVASVDSGNLTIALKTKAGTDPSPTDPINIAFRDSDFTSGNYNVRELTSALSFTAYAGSKFGNLANDTPFRLWIGLFDDAGTIRLSACTCTSYFPGPKQVIFNLALPEFGVLSSHAEGVGHGIGAFIFTQVAVTDKPFRALAFMDWGSGLPNINVWSAAPDSIDLTSQGTKRAGDVVSTARYVNPTENTVTNIIPFDNTKPQSTEGTNHFRILKVQSAVNYIRGRIRTSVSSDTPGVYAIIAVFNNAEADASAAVAKYLATANVTEQMSMDYMFQAGAAGDIVVVYNTGPSATATLTLNGNAGASLFGGILADGDTLEEIMA